MHFPFLRIFLTIATLQTITAAVAEPAHQKIMLAGSQASIAGPTKVFTGHVRIDPLWSANKDINSTGAMVIFEPGARSAWHTHPYGQRLVVSSGIGLVQEWGKPIQIVHPGDVIWCPRGVKHWHGAAPKTGVTYLTVTGTVNGKNVNWMEKVTKEQYEATPNIANLNIKESQNITNTPIASTTLSAQQQAIIPIAAFAAAGNMPKLNSSLNQGLNVGLTINDVKEILIQLYAYAGFPRSLNALGELMKVLKTREQHGIQDVLGQEPSPNIPKGDILLATGTANQTKLVGMPVKGPLFDFAPAIDEYLKTHLFGDIFERDNLNWTNRELATIAMLSALPGAEGQLQSHIAIGMNVGLTANQLRQIIQILTDHVSAEYAQRTYEALNRQMATQSGDK